MTNNNDDDIETASLILDAANCKLTTEVGRVRIELPDDGSVSGASIHDAILRALPRATAPTTTFALYLAGAAALDAGQAWEVLDELLDDEDDEDDEDEDDDELSWSDEDDA